MHVFMSIVVPVPRNAFGNLGTREVTSQDLRSQKAKDKHRQSYRKVHIVSMSWLVESAGLAGSRFAVR